MVETLSIGGVDRDAVLASIRIRKTTDGIDTLDCEIDSVDSSYRPDLYDEVIFTRDGSNKEFGGLVVDPVEHGLAGQTIGGSITTVVAAQGYLVRAERAVTNGTFPAGTLKSKIEQLMADTANPLPWITMDPSQADGPDLPETTYDYAKTKDVLDEWALLSGWPYQIDPSGVLLYSEPGSLSADFDIVDGDGNTVGDIEVAPTHAEYYNKIVVRAGAITSIAFDVTEIDDKGLHVLVVQAPEDTTTQEAADALAAAILARSIVILKRVTYKTFNAGVGPGQAQNIVIADRNINNDFLIGEVELFFEQDQLVRQVTAVEGLVYQTGWREQFKKLLGAGGGTSVAGAAGGGSGGGGSSGFQRFAQFLGGNENGVRSATPTWVRASAKTVQMDTVARGTTSALLVVRLRAFDAGVSVQARLFDLTANAACAGTSSVITNTSWQTDSWTVTLTPGSHEYALELLPGTADSDVAGIGDIY